MPIDSIIINDHKVQMGNSSTEHSKFKRDIKAILQEMLNPHISMLEELSVFNINGIPSEYKAGRESRHVIFANTTRKGAPDVKTKKQFVAGDIAFETDFFEPLGNGLVILSDDGVPLAEFHRDYFELNILFNIFAEYTPVAKSLFRYIIQKWYELYWKVKELEHSWVHTSDKNALTKRFESRMKEQLDRTIRENRQQVENYERQIDEYKRKIKSYSDNTIRLRNQIEMETGNMSNVSKKLIDDLNLIVAHQKVSDLHIKDNKFIVFIPNVYAYDDHNNRYYIGNFRVEIKIETADVRFFGDNPRRSFWSEADPHPHVNGRPGAGNACLGNVSSTIAELASRNEVYALVLTCIDFLESVNLQDSAGRNVTNWDKVDKDGNVIQSGEHGEDYDGDEDAWICDHCGEVQPGTHDTFRVFRHINNNELDEERIVCGDCLDNYTFWDSIDEYVHSIYDEDDYINEDGESTLD